MERGSGSLGRPSLGSVLPEDGFHESVVALLGSTGVNRNLRLGEFGRVGTGSRRTAQSPRTKTSVCEV